MSGVQRKWIVWLLVATVPVLAVLSIRAQDDVLQFAYIAAFVGVTGLLVAARWDRLSMQAISRSILAIGIVLMLLGFWDLVQVDASPVAGSSVVFRAVALVAGVTFITVGPRLGLLLSSGYIALGTVVLVLIDVHPLGGGMLDPGIVQTIGLLAVIVAIFRTLTATVQRLEQSAEEASASARLAYRDELTGLPNRRQLTVHLAAAAARAREGGKPDAVVMFDLDHFKDINDMQGHDVGDEVLRRTAAIASAAVRDGDVVGRWGGEEFVALLLEADEDQAVQVAERCRRALEAVGGPTAVTASFGISRLSGTDSVTDTLRRVDLALYEAKAKGRNRVEVLPASSAAPADPEPDEEEGAPAPPAPYSHGRRSSDRLAAEHPPPRPRQPSEGGRPR